MSWSSLHRQASIPTLAQACAGSFTAAVVELTEEGNNNNNNDNKIKIKNKNPAVIKYKLSEIQSADYVVFNVYFFASVKVTVLVLLAIGVMFLSGPDRLSVNDTLLLCSELSPLELDVARIRRITVLNSETSSSRMRATCLLSSNFPFWPPCVQCLLPPGRLRHPAASVVKSGHLEIHIDFFLFFSFLSLKKKKKIFIVFFKKLWFFCIGMHSVRDHVREWEKGSAHGQEPLLWWRELLHYSSGRGKNRSLLGIHKSNQYILTSASTAPYTSCTSFASLCTFCISTFLPFWPQIIEFSLNDSHTITLSRQVTTFFSLIAAVQALHSARLST